MAMGGKYQVFWQAKLYGFVASAAIKFNSSLSPHLIGQVSNSPIVPGGDHKVFYLEVQSPLEGILRGRVMFWSRNVVGYYETPRKFPISLFKFVPQCARCNRAFIESVIMEDPNAISRWSLLGAARIGQFIGTCAM